MSFMFYYAGYHANYLLDLISWKNNTIQVQDYQAFNEGVQCKVISPFDVEEQKCNE